MCELCHKAAMYTVEVNGLTVCEECCPFAWAITDYDQRHASYSGRHVTLNGADAKIVGLRGLAAIIAPLDSDKRPLSFSWHAVARVVAGKGGAFKS